ncbi:hypothetical protein P692DRAFT_20806481 [Suillus brevipes Sb2]|nr:hypothetical protein P692DRAFT_20806481 [Suillus brevipes Sb2]
MANSESSTGLALDAASLMSIVLEGILYGRVSFSVLMFIGTMWIFTYKRRMRDVRLQLPLCCSY